MTRVELKREIARLRPHAQRSGDRVFAFSYHEDGLLEVRVWPDGRAEIRRCDGSGIPLEQPRAVHWHTRP